jgi:cobalt/nickel transport system permease protein
MKGIALKKAVLQHFVVIVLGLLVCGFVAPSWAEEWPGVDEVVVKKFAEKAGHPPREPYINTAQGDMLLFFFLLAGTTGGFVGGYHFRGLFPPREKK